MGSVDRLGSALLFACYFAASPNAAAETPPAVPIWRAPAECPQEAAFTAQVERFLGQKLSAERDQSLAIACDVRGTADGGYVAALRVRTASGTQERELAHRDCAELTEAAALVTALAIDPSLVLPDAAAEPDASAKAPTAPAPAGDTKPPAPPVTPPPRKVAPGPSSAPAEIVPAAPRREHELHPAVGALGLFGSAVLPGVGAGVRGRAQLGRGRFALALAGDYWLPRFRGINGSGGAGVELGAWGVGLNVCALPLAPQLLLSVCVGPAAGDLHGSGNDLLTNPRTSHRRWSAVSAEVDLVIAAKSVISPWFGVELGKTLEAPSFGISEDGQQLEVFTPRGWILNAFVGLGVFR